MKPEEILHRLKTIISDCEYRNELVWSADPEKDPYICGYDSSNEISIQIFFGNTGRFVIEYLGHTKMRKYIKNPSDNDYECYFYILKDLVDSSNRFRKQVNNFPKFTTEDNRTYQIDKIISENLS